MLAAHTYAGARTEGCLTGMDGPKMTIAPLLPLLGPCSVMVALVITSMVPSGHFMVVL